MMLQVPCMTVSGVARNGWWTESLFKFGSVQHLSSCSCCVEHFVKCTSLPELEAARQGSDLNKSLY